MSAENIQKAIDESLDEIRELDAAFMMEVVGVAEAIDRLREALDQLDACLDDREFEKASNLGYRDIVSNFIFLQRTLGGLHQQTLKKSQIISGIALRSGVGVYEQVAPFMEEILQSSKPLTPAQKKKNREAAKKLKKLFFQNRLQYCLYFNTPAVKISCRGGAGLSTTQSEGMMMGNKRRGTVPGVYQDV